MLGDLAASKIGYGSGAVLCSAQRVVFDAWVLRLEPDRMYFVVGRSKGATLRRIEG
jgi:hypothetical protein